MGKAKHKANKNFQTPKRSFKFSVYFLVIVVCFVIPLVRFETTLDPVLYPRITALAISVFILTILMFIENGKNKMNAGLFKNGFFIAFGFFILISIASLFFAINPIEGLTDIFKWILIFMLSILGTILMIHSKEFFQLLLKGIIINAFIFFIIGIVQYFENSFLNTDTNALYEIKGLMAHKNQFSISLFVLLPFLLSGIVILNKRWQKLAVLSSILVLLLILILQTRAVWISIFVSGFISAIIFLTANSRKGFILLKNKNLKRIFYSGVFFITLIVLITIIIPVGPFKSINKRANTIFNPEFSSNEWRMQMWDSTIELTKDHPISGVGAGNWKISIYPYYGEYLPSVYRHWRNPHNDYLLALAEKGFPGLIGFISMFLLLVYFGLWNVFRSRNIKDVLIFSFFVFGIFGYMLISFFSFPNERVNHLIFVSLAAAYIISAYLKPEVFKENSGFHKLWIVLPFVVFLYLAVHFGIISTRTEMNIKIAQTLQLKKDWKAMSYFAEKAYSPYSHIEPQNSYPIIMYSGLASYSKGEYEKALNEFREANEQHPTNISVLNNLGSVYGELGRMDSSIYFHKKTLEIFPHYEFGLLNLTKSFYLNNNYEKAYQMILHCDPKTTNQEVFQLKAAIEYKLQEFEN